MTFLTAGIFRWQAALALFGWLMYGSSALAAVQQITVVGIGIDKKIDIAEAKAVDYAKKRAVYLLAEKWNLPDAPTRIAKLPQKIFDQSVRGTEIKRRAKNGNTLYVEVVVSIQDIPLRRALGMEIQASKEVESRRGILVIPVMIDEDTVRVWGEGNLLIAPLKVAVREMGKEAVIVAAGDREDRSRIDYDNALKVDFKTLEVLAKRYGAEEILMAIVTPGAPGTDTPTNMLMQRLQPGGSRLEELSLKAAATQTDSERFAEAADAIARYATVISRSVAEAEREAWSKFPKYNVEITFTTIAEFGTIENALRAAPGMKRFELPAISLQHVQGVMYVEGDVSKLRKYLIKQGIKLTEVGDVWKLSLR
jgi:hypothetical protein